jgi:transposase
MANVLKMAKKYAIIGLLENGWSYRRIARELSVDRETVARYDRLRKSNPANPPAVAESSDGSNPAIPTPGYHPEGDSKPATPTAGSDSFAHPNAAISTPECNQAVDSKPAISTPGSSDTLPGRSSLCEPLSEVIEGKLDQGLSAQRIFQDLYADHGFTGSYSSIKRFVRRIKASTPLPFRRMEVEPGEEAQVDFGTGALIEEDGRRRRPHILRVVLSHSRKGYSEPVLRQTTEDFIRTLENAFRHFGGGPKTLVIDNLKAAVTRADWFDPDLTACRKTRFAVLHFKANSVTYAKYAYSLAFRAPCNSSFFARLQIQSFSTGCQIPRSLSSPVTTTS